MDNTAKVGGIMTAFLTWTSGALAAAFHPSEAPGLAQVVIAIIGGLFGMAGTSLAVIVKHWVENRKKDRD